MRGLAGDWFEQGVVAADGGVFQAGDDELDRGAATLLGDNPFGRRGFACFLAAELQRADQLFLQDDLSLIEYFNNHASVASARMRRNYSFKDYIGRVSG